MKKPLLILSVLSLIVSNSFAQLDIIPNSNFDNWTSGEPDGWGTSNSLSPLTAGAVSQAIGADILGANTIVLKTLNVPINGAIPGLAISNGNINVVGGIPIISGGFPFRQRAIALKGMSKYISGGGADAPNVSIILTRWNMLTNTRDTIGTGTASPTNTTYANFTVPIVYGSSAIAPDSAQIILASSGNTGAVVGSQFFVDSLAFDYGCTLDPSIISTGGFDQIPSTNDTLKLTAGAFFSKTWTMYFPANITSPVPATLDSIKILPSQITTTGLGSSTSYTITSNWPNYMFGVNTVACLTISGTVPTIPTNGFGDVTITPKVFGSGVLSAFPNGFDAPAAKTIVQIGTGGNLSGSISKTDVNCYNYKNGSATITTSFNTGPVKYKWAPTGGTTATATGLSAGTYSCTISDLSYTVTQTVTIGFNDNNFHSQNTSDITSVNATCSSSNGSAAYGGNNSNYKWSTGSTSPNISNLTPGAYFFTATSGSCHDTIPFVISNGGLPTQVPICLVTVNKTSTHNTIIWEKPLSTAKDSFAIYREVTTGAYKKIAAVSYDSLSEYNDYTADPNATSYKYKMTVLDKCGHETALGSFHNTIHLQSLGGGNFQWTLYEIENQTNPVTYFKVYRDDNGTGNFLPISSTIPGTNSTYTDVDASTFQNAVYYVEAVWNINCSPTRAVTSTRSNTKNLNGTGVLSYNTLENGIEIYPNPTSVSIIVTLPELSGKSSITIINVLGETVYNETVTSKTKTISVENFAAGVYTVVVNNNGNNAFKKLMVN